MRLVARLSPRTWIAPASSKQAIWALAGFALVVMWALWWASSLRHNKLLKGHRFWLPAYQTLGIDFANNYHAARHWLAGGNPYDEPFGDPLDRKMSYPPLAFRSFAWCGAFSERDAYRIWWGVLALIATAGALAAWRSRTELGCWNMPWPWALAAVLWSTPVLYALERGNYDLLVVPFLLLAAWALRGQSLARDAGAGACLAVAVLIKLYPAIVVLGLAPLGRWRALACCAAVAAPLGLIGFRDLPVWRQNAKELLEHEPPALDSRVHSLSTGWQPFWSDTRLARLGQLPGRAVAFALVLPLILWVSYRLWQLPASPAMTLPYFLWLAAAATYVPEVAHDYNLIFLPLAALAVWDRRDPVWLHLIMAFLLIWWQPFAIVIDMKVLFLAKYLALGAVGVSIVNRAVEQAACRATITRPANDMPPLLPAAA